MKNINPIILILIISDTIIYTGFGLIDPIMAIYINDSVIGGSIFTAGIASTIFMAVKSSVQLPFAKFVDRLENGGNHPKHISTIPLIISTFLFCLSPFIYIFAHHIAWIFVASIIHGLGAGLAFPTWLKLWEIHLDKGKESFEWSLYSTIVSITMAISAAVGASIAQFMGFQVTFLLVGVISVIGTATLLFLKNESVAIIKTPKI